MPPVLHRQAEAGRHRWPRRALRAPVRGPRRKEEEVADDKRQQGLRQAKLRALVKGRWGEGERRAEPFPAGAALVEGGTGWVLVEDDPERALGRSLLWAGKAPVEDLHVLAETGAGVLARRATAFAKPPRVWQVDGTSVAEAEPDPPPEEPPVDPRATPLADVIRAAGAEPVVEHGVLRAEVLGLEVARVEVDEEGAWLEVGVGKHDRHAQRLVHADEPRQDSLVRAVATVEGHRRAGAPLHPYNRLAPERWLRALAIADPAIVGAVHLSPVPSPVERDDLRKPAPAPAAGEDRDGRPLLAVFSTGVDVDLVPAAADARLADGRDPRLVLVVPERDDHPYLRAMAQALREPAEIVTVSNAWRGS